jgi:uncharacterized membrane protein YkvA (DUF1232 family)
MRVNYLSILQLKKPRVNMPARIGFSATSRAAFMGAITAMNYFVDPFDLIPDEVPFLGFVDDATVMQFAVARTRQALDDFMTWETTAL